MQFKSLVGTAFETKAVNNVYLEFCSTRIQEFIDGYRQEAAKAGESSTIAGQNLRDTLLTFHVNRTVT